MQILLTRDPFLSEPVESGTLWQTNLILIWTALIPLNQLCPSTILQHWKLATIVKTLVRLKLFVLNVIPVVASPVPFLVVCSIC